MAFNPMPYLDQAVLDALHSMDPAQMRPHAVGPDGAPSSLCLAYAAYKEDLALLKTLLALQDLPHPDTVLCALKWWSDACFQVVLEDATAKYTAFEQPGALLKYPDFHQQFMYNAFLACLDDLKTAVSEALGDASCSEQTWERIMRLLDTPLGAALVMVIPAARPTASTTCAEEAADPYDLPCGGAPECGRTCINPYCSDCM